jgi:hypothetical protein
MEEIVTAVLDLFSSRQFKNLIKAVDSYSASLSIEDDVALEAEHISKTIT